MEQRPATFRVKGHALRTERMRQGLGIDETAKAAGISRSYLQRLETGARQHMRPGSYIRLRTVLNSTDTELLAPPEEPTEKR